MRLKFAASLMGVCLLAVAVVYAADPVMEGVTCVIGSKKPAKVENAVDYKGGKVYFCCENCPKAFAASPEKHAIAANHQLVQTGQAKQVGCPFSGKAVNPEAKAKVGSVEVGFCCEGCLGKVTNATSSKAAMELVFSDKAFDKGFKVGEKE